MNCEFEIGRQNSGKLLAADNAQPESKRAKPTKIYSINPANLKQEQKIKRTAPGRCNGAGVDHRRKDEANERRMAELEFIQPATLRKKLTYQMGKSVVATAVPLFAFSSCQ